MCLRLLREEDGAAVTEWAGVFTAVLITPAKVPTASATHDCTLAVVCRARFSLFPVGVGDGFLVQPVPLPGLGAAAHAYPQVLQTIIAGLSQFFVDVLLKLSLGEADQVQAVVLAIRQGFPPAACHFSNQQNLWGQETPSWICFGQAEISILKGTILMEPILKTSQPIVSLDHNHSKRIQATTLPCVCFSTKICYKDHTLASVKEVHLEY